MVQTRGAGQNSPSKLKFKDKLVGKGLATDALLKKLKVLHKELQELDQEQVDVSSLSGARKELVNASLLLHKDRGVKAYTACCLADILRLYAPDAPYTQGELQDIFEFFFRQLVAGLQGADAAYYTQYYHLLESLSGVKSVVLVCDLPKADSLMVTVFKEMFTLIKRDLPKKIEMFIAEILVALIDECSTLPSDVLEKFLLPQFRGKHAKTDQPGYRLAVSVCNAAADKLQRHVCQYFTDVIVEHSANEEYEEIATAHELIKHLNRSCPSLLHNVVPQLEEELRAEDIQLRVLSAQVLAEMFAEKGGKSLMTKYPSTWEFWLGRRNDKDTLVRVTWVEATRGLIINLPDMRQAIEESLKEKIFDPDDKVRSAVCKLYSSLDYETVLHHVSVDQLKAISSRIRDKKPAVRNQALSCLGKLFNMAYPELENNDPTAVDHFAWIPQSVFSGLTSSDTKPYTEQVLHEFILPLPASTTTSTSKGQAAEVDEVAWTERLLLVLKHTDDSGVKALLANSGLKIVRPSPFDKCLKACVDYNGGVIDKDEEQVTEALNLSIRKAAALCPDPHRALDDLLAFAKLNEGRLFKLLHTCMDPQTDLKNLVKATHDFRRRLEQSSASLLPTLDFIIRRTSLSIINQSSIPTLLKRVQRGESSVGELAVTTSHAHTILTFISKHCPALFKSHVAELTKTLGEERSDMVSEICLQALSAVSKWNKSLVPTDKRNLERIARFAQSANVRQAKFAARLLAVSAGNTVCVRSVEALADALLEAEPEQVVAHLAALAQLALMAPDAFEHRSDVITAFIMKHVLQASSPPPEGKRKAQSDWVPDGELWPELHAKILAIKVCRNRCLARADDEEATDLATPVLKLLFTILNNDGSLKADAGDDPRVQGRLRLQSAVSLLRLACVKEYADVILQPASFLILAITTQDSCFEVRLKFTTKLVGLLATRRLPAPFTIIPFLTVHDPEKEITEIARSVVEFAVKNFPKDVKMDRVEFPLLRLFHLIAHHPDFEISDGPLREMAKYIQHYASLVANADNISLLYYLAQRLKTVRDTDDAHSANLYCVSELAQEVLKARAHAHGWTILSYPGKIKMPSDIFQPLANAEQNNKIQKHVYLPQETVDWLGQGGKAEKQKAERAKAERKPAAKRKATSTARTNGKAKRARRKKRDEDEESDEDSSDADQDEASEASDAEMDVDGQADGKEEAQEEEQEGRRGRGARTRAMAKIRQQTKGKKKARPSAVTSESE